MSSCIQLDAKNPNNVRILGVYLFLAVILAVLSFGLSIMMFMVTNVSGCRSPANINFNDRLITDLSDTETRYFLEENQLFLEDKINNEIIHLGAFAYSEIDEGVDPAVIRHYTVGRQVWGCPLTFATVKSGVQDDRVPFYHVFSTFSLFKIENSTTS